MLRSNKTRNLGNIGEHLSDHIKIEQLCSDFYKSEDMADVIQKIMNADEGPGTVEIAPLDKDKLEFLRLLKALHYIEDGDIILEQVPNYAIIKLNGHFRKNFQKDMEYEANRQNFMEKFGDPLDGLDLRKPIVLWFPTYFVMIRIIFVAGSLLLWKYPLMVLLVRLFTALFGFIVISTLRFYDSKSANILELMNEATLIFLCDCILVFTNVMN